MSGNKKKKIEDEEVDAIMNKVEPTEKDVEKLADWAMQVWNECEKRKSGKAKDD